MKKAVLILIGIFLLVGFREVRAQQPVDVKITTVQLRHQQCGVGIERIAKYAQEKLKNKVRVRTYPAAQLYTGQEEVQAVIKGELQMAYVIGASLEPVDPSLELIKLPFLFPDIEVSYIVLEGSVGKKLFDKLDQKGVSVLGIVSSGSVAMSNNKRPIKNVEDCKGLKMRSFGPMGASTLKAMGAMAIVTASEETYSALQQGVIDGLTTPATVFFARKYYDVQKFVTNVGMLNAVHVFVIGNRTWWNNLPADIREGLNDSIQRMVKEQRVEIQAEDKNIFEQIAAKGCQVVDIAQAEQLAWKKALQTVYQEFGPKIGTNLVKEAQQEVERLSKVKK